MGVERARLTRLRAEGGRRMPFVVLALSILPRVAFSGVGSASVEVFGLPIDVGRDFVPRGENVYGIDGTSDSEVIVALAPYAGAGAGTVFGLTPPSPSGSSTGGTLTSVLRACRSRSLPPDIPNPVLPARPNELIRIRLGLVTGLYVTCSATRTSPSPLSSSYPNIGLPGAGSGSDTLFEADDVCRCTCGESGTYTVGCRNTGDWIGGSSSVGGISIITSSGSSPSKIRVSHSGSKWALVRLIVSMDTGREAALALGRGDSDSSFEFTFSFDELDSHPESSALRLESDLESASESESASASASAARWDITGEKAWSPWSGSGSERASSSDA